MDEALLPARKPRLPSGARGSTRKRTSETATQTVTTVGTQTEAARAAASRAAELIGGGGALGERGTLGGPPLWRVHAVGDEDGGAAAPAHAHPAASPLRVPGVAVGTSPGRAPALGSPGRRSSVGSSASSAEQLEQLDSLLREHQQLLKARVDGVRVDHQRKQRDWFASAGQEPPSPPRAAGRGGAGAGQPPRSGAQQAAAATRGSCAPPEGPSSRPTSAPPTPARGAALGMHGSALSAGLSPRARKEDKGCNSEPDIAPSMCARAPPRPARLPFSAPPPPLLPLVLPRAALRLATPSHTQANLRARALAVARPAPGAPRSSRSPSSRRCSRSSTAS